MIHTQDDLRQFQALPLDVKVLMTQERIRTWINEYGSSGVYISFSGGKDSTVLLDIVRNKMGYDIPAIFVNTGLEYPSVRKFAESKDNVYTIRPQLNFREVISRYGYPIISKEVALYIHQMQRPQTEKNAITRNLRLNGIRSDGAKVSVGKLPDRYRFLIDAPFRISHLCCDQMKKKPLKHIDKRPLVATMAEESRVRKNNWMRYGCNAFALKNPISAPMSFWTEQDILQYIKENNLKIAEAYGDVIEIPNLVTTEYKTTKANRTGCIFCMFGILKELDRFIKLNEDEPQLCDYVMRGGCFEDGWWIPTKEGLGYWFVIEYLNKYGNMNIEMPNREKYLALRTEETDKYL